MSCLHSASPFCDGRVTLQARPTFLHIYTMVKARQSEHAHINARLSWRGWEGEPCIQDNDLLMRNSGRVPEYFDQKMKDVLAMVLAAIQNRRSNGNQSSYSEGKCLSRIKYLLSLRVLVQSFFWKWKNDHRSLLYNQVQTEVHVGSVTMDTDWSETALTYIADGYSDLEATGERPYLSNCSRRRFQCQFSQPMSCECTQRRAG